MDDEATFAAQAFEQHRTHLRSVAYRMLGSISEADDAVQEAWLRLSRTGADGIENLGGWLTTVVARVCLDALRSRRSRREEPLDASGPEPSSADRAGALDPEQEAQMADSVGLALLVVLEALTPAERVAFVMHDMFDLSFDEIAPIVDRTPEATRQLASRARRRVRGAEEPAIDLARRRKVVSAFLAASRHGDFEGLLAVLSPDAVLRADGPAVKMAAARQRQGAPFLAPEIRGAALVANSFKGRARAALSALIDGEAGAVWAVRGQVRAAFVFTFEHDTVTAIDLITAPQHLAELDVKLD